MVAGHKHILHHHIILYLGPGASWGGSLQSEPDVWSRGDAASGHTAGGGPGTEGAHGSLRCTPPATAESQGVRYWGDKNVYVNYNVSPGYSLIEVKGGLEHISIIWDGQMKKIINVNFRGKVSLEWDDVNPRMSAHTHLRRQMVLSRLATESSLWKSKHNQVSAENETSVIRATHRDNMVTSWWQKKSCKQQKVQGLIVYKCSSCGNVLQHSESLRRHRGLVTEWWESPSGINNGIINI